MATHANRFCARVQTPRVIGYHALVNEKRGTLLWRSYFVREDVVERVHTYLRAGLATTTTTHHTLREQGLTQIRIGAKSTCAVIQAIGLLVAI